MARTALVYLGLAAVVFAGAANGVLADSTNLIVNGDFEAGNSAFTADYTYRHDGDLAPGQYDIVDDPNKAYASAASYGDHTSGSGLMYVTNGATDASKAAWSETVTVSPDHDYNFTMWASSWYWHAGEKAARLAVYVNGVQIGGTFTSTCSNRPATRTSSRTRAAARASITARPMPANPTPSCSTPPRPVSFRPSTRSASPTKTCRARRTTP